MEEHHENISDLCGDDVQIHNDDSKPRTQAQPHWEYMECLSASNVCSLLCE
jgi:hypothetical protein